MWVFLTRRLRWWLIGSVAVPVAGWGLSRLGRLLEQRRGPSAVTGGLQAAVRRLTRPSAAPTPVPVVRPGASHRPASSPHARQIAELNRQVIDESLGRHPADEGPTAS